MPTRLEITGKVNEEGIIEGKLAMPGHDLPYTAERLLRTLNQVRQ